MKTRQTVDPYRELGVDDAADGQTVREAYHRKARANHPDLGGNDQVMARVNSAYDMLKDPARRAAHDRQTAEAAAAARGPQAPPWTGAAGPPPGRPAGPKLDFGIFAGWTLGEVARTDPGYLVWLAERIEGRPFLDAIEQIVAPLREASRASPRTGDAARPGRARMVRR